MENASKALIIAGAILLAISIIGLGIYIFAQAQGAMTADPLKMQQIEAFNSQFDIYQGEQSGTNVKTLLDKIRSHNLTSAEDETRQIGVVESAASVTDVSQSRGVLSASDINSIKSGIRAGATYTVTFSYDAKSGYLIQVGITIVELEYN